MEKYLPATHWRTCPSVLKVVEKNGDPGRLREPDREAMALPALVKDVVRPECLPRESCRARPRVGAVHVLIYVCRAHLGYTPVPGCGIFVVQCVLASWACLSTFSSFVLIQNTYDHLGWNRSCLAC